MKNQILALLAILALFGLTATGAEAHTVHGPSHGHGHYNHHHFYHGQWYDDDCYAPDYIAVPGFSINFNL